MPQTPNPREVPRLSPQEVRQKMLAGAGRVHLVCAYEDENKCRQLQLDGVSLKEFEERIGEIQKDDELVFYCAWPNEATAASVAANYIARGYARSAALKDGVEGWRNAGFATVWRREATSAVEP